MQQRLFVAILRAWFVPAFVPDDDIPCAIVILGDDAFEVTVVEGVVFGLNRQVMVVRVHAGAFGYSPTLQHAVHLEAEVIMERCGVMLLHHKPKFAPAVTALFGALW